MSKHATKRSAKRKKTENEARVFFFFFFLSQGCRSTRLL